MKQDAMDLRQRIGRLAQATGKTFDEIANMPWEEIEALQRQAIEQRQGAVRAKSSEQYTFGPWLQEKIKNQGMSQKEFADKVGVGQGSVSRWIQRRTPKAQYIRPIANVLMVDYDVVNTKAGYRPRDLDKRLTDPESAESQILYVAQHINWTPERLSSVLALLRSLAEVSRTERQSEARQENLDP